MEAVLQTRPRPVLTTDRLFYTGMALFLAALVAVGFSATFYLRGTALPPLSPLLVLHGVVFTAWFALLITQTGLIAINRRGWHRTLGSAGVILAAAMVVIGTFAAVDALRRGAVPVPGLDARSFFAIPMHDMVVFPILVAAAVWFRRDAETHKRLMLLATISLMAAAVARFPFEFIMANGPLAFYGLQDALILIGVVYDKLAHGRVHHAYWWGGGLIVLTQPLFLAISGTPLWLSFADLFLAS